MKKIYTHLKTVFLTAFTGTVLLSNAQTTITLGTGTTANSNFGPGPINEYYRSAHCQILYTKAEINAAGIFGGTMTKFGFNIVTGVVNQLPNFTIKMKGTSAPDVAVYDGAGLTTVYNVANYNPTAGGFQLLTLSTPFIWNGVDNILVDVCFDQVIPSWNASGTVMLYTTPVANSFNYIRLDSSPQCGVACSNPTSNKPLAQMTFLPPPPIDLGVNAFVKPTANKKCFGNDTIKVRVFNYGSNPVNFATQTTTVTVKSTGMVTGTYTLAINTGSLASNAYRDTTVTTSYNMSQKGTYNLKGYTTIVGDGQPLNDTVSTSITKKAFFTITTSPSDSVCKGVPVQFNATAKPAQLGNGTVTNYYYSYPAPYGNWQQGAKHQFLFLASELSAAGLIAGNINYLTFNTSNLNNSAPLTNFNIAAGTTTLTSLTVMQPSLTTVFSAASYTPVLGINTHSFTTPFSWNGTDNVIIETCFNNTPSTSTKNVSFYQTNMPFNATVYYSQSNNPSLCSSSGAGGSYSTMRPNVQFGQNLPLSYTWTPGTGLSSTSIGNPVATPPTTTVYTVSLNFTTLNCSSYDTTYIFIKQTPTLNLGHDTSVCTPNYLLNAGVNASTYQWSTGATTQTISVNTTGLYSAIATSSVGCVKKDTVSVTFAPLPIVTLGHDTGFCQGSSIILNSGNPSDLHSWGKIGGGFSATTQTVSVNTPGAYYAIVTSTVSNSCVQSDTVNVISKPKPNVSLAFSNTPPKLLCQFSAPRTLTEGTPSGGIYLGPGVSGNTFNPALVGPGNYLIMYEYTGPNGCSNQATDTLRVKTCVGIEEYGSSATLSIYPNPSNGAFTIAIDSPSDLKAAISIVTIDGRLVYQDNITATSGLYEKQVNISDLANGIYYLKMQSGNTVKSYKVIKQ